LAENEETLEVQVIQIHIWLAGGRKERRPLGRSWRKRNGKMKVDPEEVGLIEIVCFSWLRIGSRGGLL
jgi:hypothetical protein